MGLQHRGPRRHHRRQFGAPPMGSPDNGPLSVITFGAGRATPILLTITPTSDPTPAVVPPPVVTEDTPLVSPTVMNGPPLAGTPTTAAIPIASSIPPVAPTTTSSKSVQTTPPPTTDTPAPPPPVVVSSTVPAPSISPSFSSAPVISSTTPLPIASSPAQTQGALPTEGHAKTAGVLGTLFAIFALLIVTAIVFGIRRTRRAREQQRVALYGNFFSHDKHPPPASRADVYDFGASPYPQDLGAGGVGGLGQGMYPASLPRVPPPVHHPSWDRKPLPTVPEKDVYGGAEEELSEEEQSSAGHSWDGTTAAHGTTAEDAKLQYGFALAHGLSLDRKASFRGTTPAKISATPDQIARGHHHLPHPIAAFPVPPSSSSSPPSSLPAPVPVRPLSIHVSLAPAEPPIRVLLAPSSPPSAAPADPTVPSSSALTTSAPSLPTLTLPTAVPATPAPAVVAPASHDQVPGSTATHGSTEPPRTPPSPEEPAAKHRSMAGSISELPYAS